MGNFKLIALRPLEGVEGHILKNLKIGQFYFQDNSYEPSGDHLGIKKVLNANGEPHADFFFNGKSDEHSSLNAVNFQAIVGKNGEGKSTLIDFIIRLLNNFYSLLLKKEFNQVLFVHGVFGELYFEVSGSLFRLTFRELQDPTFEIIEKTSASTIWAKGDQVLRDEFKQVFFFTLGINYSLYSWNALHYSLDKTTDYSRFNSLDFPLEPRNSWLNRLFHKNDGYLTPIALHPYRDKGRIDVNSEEFLTRQRLLSLCITPELNFEKISEEQYFSDFILSNNNTNFIDKAITAAEVTAIDYRDSSIYALMEMKWPTMIAENWEEMEEVFIFTFSRITFYITTYKKLVSLWKERPIMKIDQIFSKTEERCF